MQRQILPILAAAGVTLGVSLLIYSHYYTSRTKKEKRRLEGQKEFVQKAPEVGKNSTATVASTTSSSTSSNPCQHTTNDEPMQVVKLARVQETAQLSSAAPEVAVDTADCRYDCLSPRCSRFYKTEEGMRDHMRDSKKCRPFAVGLKQHTKDHLVVAPKPLAKSAQPVGVNDFVHALATNDPHVAIGMGKTSKDGDDQFDRPRGVAFVPAHPWIVISDTSNNRIKIHHMQTQALICKLGKEGSWYQSKGAEKGQFSQPYGVAVSADSSLIVVVESVNHRVQVLRLTVAADKSTAQLEFVRFIGTGEKGGGEGQFRGPRGITLKQPQAESSAAGAGGEETMLVADSNNHWIQELGLDGKFIRGFGTYGSGDGQLNRPFDVVVLPTTGQVAVADCGNHRVVIFDADGTFSHSFGSFGEEDGEFRAPSGVASDELGQLLVVDQMTDRLQVFSAEGEHLCTRHDLGLTAGRNARKGIALRGDQAQGYLLRVCN
jgi:DNA-binding beta-propeller fold protein YncE